VPSVGSGMFAGGMKCSEADREQWAVISGKWSVMSGPWKA